MVYRDVSLRHLRDFLSAPLKAQALKDLSLEVGEGETHAILGENGAGKTTLLKIIAGLILPAEGNVSVCGHDVIRSPYLVRKKLGFVIAEERSFYWRLSGRRNLQFFAALHNLNSRDTQSRIDDLSKKLRLEEWLDRPFRNLSSGIRQRFALARGLINRPKVLLLDEPTRSLDPRAASEFIELLQELKHDQPMTVLLATHNSRELIVADRISILKKGRWGWSGNLKDLQIKGDLNDTIIALLKTSESPS